MTEDTLIMYAMYIQMDSTIKANILRNKLRMMIVVATMKDKVRGVISGSIEAILEKISVAI